MKENNWKDTIIRRVVVEIVHGYPLITTVINLVNQIENKDFREATKVDLVNSLIARGKIEWAKKIAETIEDPINKAIAYTRIAKESKSNEDINEALKVVQEIDDSVMKKEFLNAIIALL